VPAISMQVRPETFVFGFGKHEDETYEDVLYYDAQYIVWCHNNVEGFTLSERDLNHAKSMSAEQYTPRRRFPSGLRWAGTEHGLEVYGSDIMF
jgi:hypothetical protein